MIFNFEPPKDKSLLNFEPDPLASLLGTDYIEVELEFILPHVAEETIVQTIIAGSGGPENQNMTEPGLRFVRHLLSSSKSNNLECIPNLKNKEIIYMLARDFIKRAGGPASALETMRQITVG